MSNSVPMEQRNLIFAISQNLILIGPGLSVRREVPKTDV